MSYLGERADEETARRTRIREDFLEGLSSDEKWARSRGRFFGTMNQLWQVEYLPIQANWFNAIQRSAAQGNHLYANTRSLENLVHPISQSDASSVTNTIQTRPTRFDLFQNDTAQRAHLGFSDDPECHKAYGYLGQAAAGIKVDFPLMRLKLLNGVKEEGASRRQSGSGLKHHKFNKMYLERQADFFDGENPVLILVPIYDLDQVLGWNGTDAYPVMAITTPSQRGLSCSKKVLEAAPSTCSPDEVRKATNLLRIFYQAIACSVRNDDVGESFRDDQLDFNKGKITSLKKWWKYKKEHLDGENATIGLPQLKSDIDWDNIKIARGIASRESSLPDPFCMAAKAAINLSAIVGAKVMPGCELALVDEEEQVLNSMQDDEIPWPPNPRADDVASLTASFGQPVNLCSDIICNK